MRYNLGCSLSYKISSDATFIFNLEVARIASQKILKESLVLTPPIERSVYADPTTHNRYFAVTVAPGVLALEYNADVELLAHHGDPETVNRAGPGRLNNFSASISGASAGVRLPSGGAAG